MAGFKIAGVSKFNGEIKVRFANDMTRVKLLAKNGHEDITLIELPSEMDKPEIVKYLKTTEIYQNVAFKEAIDDADEKYNGAAVVKAAKTAVVKTGTKAEKTAAKPAASKTAKIAKPAATLEELKARAAATETSAE